MILKHALANAHHYGKADVRAVAAKIFAEDKEARKNAKKVLKEVEKVVGEVNRMSRQEREAKLREIAPEMLEHHKKEEKKELPDLEGAEKGKVLLRLPPEPNGYLHIGHALSFWLNYLYSKKYDGGLVLKIEDTNPVGEKEEYYDAIVRDVKWLGIRWTKKFVLSEKIDEVERAAESLIEQEKAYVCTCSTEIIKERRMKKNADPCRENGRQKNKGLWREMFAGKKHILRWKGDPAAKNSVLRDPTLYRVVNVVHPHTGKNHIAYPTYDFASPVTDGILGITHVLRSEEFLQRAELHKQIIEALGMKAPFYVHFGRFSLEGTPTSKRKIKPLVEEGVVEGWHDPRLATIMALRRRGIAPKTFEDLAMATGPFRGTRLISWKLLLGLNKKNIDPVAKRVFAIINPIELVLEGPEKTVKMRAHPIEELGERKLKIGKRLFLEKEDASGTIRLKGAYNVEIEGNTAKYAGEKMMRPIVQWISEPDMAELIMVEGMNKKTIKILVEKRKWVEGEIVQMERVGFARVDAVKPLRLMYVGG